METSSTAQCDNFTAFSFHFLLGRPFWLPHRKCPNGSLFKKKEYSKKTKTKNRKKAQRPFVIKGDSENRSGIFEEVWK